MGIRAKFNCVLAIVFLAGLLTAGGISYTLLQRNARDEVLQRAGVMMAAASAIRGYTVEQVKPHLEMQLMRTFLPQSVPAYAATETFQKLRGQYPEYTYKEAALNPTNPRNRAVEWESDVVDNFRNDRAKTELVGERDTPTGKALYLARPLKVNNEACLTCHSTPELAPKTMITAYGDSNGFSWKMDEIIGAQIVSIPMSLPIAKANHAFIIFMSCLCGVLLVVFVALNFMLRKMVILPIESMSRHAKEISKGNLEIAELAPAGKDEISDLAGSFNLMRRSLEKAMKMLE